MVKNFIYHKQLIIESDNTSKLNINQLCIDNQYDFDRPLQVIADIIYNAISYCIDVHYTRADIYSLFIENNVYGFDIADTVFSENVKSVRVGINNKKKEYYYEIIGDLHTKHTYCIYSIDTIKDDVVYLVEEHIMNPDNKFDCQAIDRCYHDYFEYFDDAYAYYMKCDAVFPYKDGKCDELSGCRLFFVSRSFIDNNAWYSDNIEIAIMLDKYNLDINTYRYMDDLELIKRYIRISAYDALSAIDRVYVDKDIVDMLYDYVDYDDMNDALDEFEEIEECIDNGEVFEPSIDISNKIIRNALVQADSEDKFKEIYSILGPGAYRIGSLTDEIWSDHEADGYILVDRDGNLKWYSELDGEIFNNWLPHHINDIDLFDSISADNRKKLFDLCGKFQENICDTLLCFREYHPDLILESLPYPSDLITMENIYSDFNAKKRAEHEEMGFCATRQSINGELDVCYGTWYPCGLYGDFYYDIEFSCIYNNYAFTEDECKQLLSGAVITVDNYVSINDGKRRTIQGKLINNVDELDDECDEPHVVFDRTDINHNTRHNLNVEFGLNI